MTLANASSSEENFDRNDYCAGNSHDLFVTFSIKGKSKERNSMQSGRKLALIFVRILSYYRKAFLSTPAHKGEEKRRYSKLPDKKVGSLPSIISSTKLPGSKELLQRFIAC